MPVRHPAARAAARPVVFVVKPYLHVQFACFVDCRGHRAPVRFLKILPAIFISIKLNQLHGTASVPNHIANLKYSNINTYLHFKRIRIANAQTQVFLKGLGVEFEIWKTTKLKANALEFQALCVTMHARKPEWMQQQDYERIARGTDSELEWIRISI